MTGFYVITVDCRHCDSSSWYECYYDVADGRWYERLYAGSLIYTLEDARKFAAEVEYQYEDEIEYDKDSLAIHKIALEYIEPVHR